MSQWIFIDIAVCCIVVVLAGFIIPQILLIAFRRNLFDQVDPRKIHKGAVPRLGGIAFFPSILFAMLLMFGISMKDNLIGVNSQIYETMGALCFATCAIVILYLVGMADDLVGVKYRAKFVAQIFAAVLIIVGGITFDDFHGFLTLGTLPYGLTVVITVFLILFITNAINLIDGIDGLASGLSAMACLFYGMVFYHHGLHIYGMLAFATLGALIPFFYYNVFGNADKHSKIFMGDTGSLTIGLILSVLSIRLCNIDMAAEEPNPAVVGLSPLLIPCFDVVRVYIHRIKAKRNPFLPDKTHIHHKLLALGMSQRMAMPTIVMSSFALTLFNYIVSPILDITLLFIIDLAIWFAINIALSRAIGRRQKRLGQILYQ